MEIHRRKHGVLVSLLGLLLAGGNCPAVGFSQTAGAPAELTYSRTLKGSTPEYLAITVDSKGSGSFEGRGLDEKQNPRTIQLTTATTERIFRLAGQLHNFQSIKLESRRKVANMGEKTLTYQQGEGVNRVVFNYTENRTAQELVDLLEAVGMVEEHITALEFKMKYDPLSLTQELLQIQIELDNRSLVDPEMMVPTLEKIVHGSRFLHLAQVRAQQIIERVQPGS